MEFAFVDLAAKLIGQKVHTAVTTVMPRPLILLTRVSKTDDQPAFNALLLNKHGSEQISDRGTAVDMGDRSCKDGSNIQLLDLLAGAVLGQRNGVVNH